MALNRRQFLAAVPAAAGFAAGQTASKIRAVDIVHHTHCDVGYTDLPAVVRDKQKRYIDQAIDTAKTDRAFRWTIESLLNLDDWWKSAPPARRRELLDLVGEGRIDVMGMPFNQTPFLNAMEWRHMLPWIPPDLWRRLNIRVAMQNDVNGFPRAGAATLLDHGVSRLLSGLNADSGGPPFRRPAAFWWKQPDGRRLFVWLGEHYGVAMRYLLPALQGDRMGTDEKSVRAAHTEFAKHMRDIEACGYEFDRLILTFTHPTHWDNGSPFPVLPRFIERWNELGLEPSLRLTTATDAALAMERLAGPRIPEMEGEWTDWWANGSASGPRELAASRVAKRCLAAAVSPVFGPPPEIDSIVRDLCLFDEHTWGAANSISEPESLNAIAQYVEKSDLGYRPMGMAQALLSRRLSALPEGLCAVNPSPAEISGWASIPADSVPSGSRSLVDLKTGARTPVYKEGGSSRAWLEKLPAASVRRFRAETSEAAEPQSDASHLVAPGWPRTISWPGMSKPLFEGTLADFICVAVGSRRAISELHGNPNPADRERIRKTLLHETAAEYGPAKRTESPHTVRYEQEIRHERLSHATRTLELWNREPRARISVRFDRLSSLAPEVFFLAFDLPAGLPLPVFSCGGVPFTPYRDQLKGTCRDYFAIDGWAHYRSGAGNWLWVTRDAPLVAVGAPHVGELHQQEPRNTNRILAMVFDNCWHTNFVADSHGTMEFQFQLLWAPALENPPALAEALNFDPIVK